MKSDELKARAAAFARIERGADAFGRIIGVKRLTESQETKIIEWSPGLDGFTTETTEDGKSVQVPKRMRLIAAACVRDVDGVPYTFPKSRAELDAVMDGLYREGIETALTLYVKLFDEDLAEGGGEAKPLVVDEAKN